MNLNETSRNLDKELLPIHLKPKKDELLSSWLTRLSLSHGLKPSVFALRIFPGTSIWRKQADIDRADCTKIFEILSFKTNTSIERMHATTLKEYQGRLFEPSLQDKRVRWLLPRYAIRRPIRESFGLQYCPLCLSETDHPYFKRQWRLAFVTCCIKHKIALYDRCYNCGKAINFYLNASGNDYKVPRTLTICYKCKSDLKNTPTSSRTPQISDCVIEFQKHLIESASHDWVQLFPNEYVHSLMYFEGLRHLVFPLVGRSELNKDVLGATIKYFGLKIDTSNLQRMTSFESCGVRMRGVAIMILQKILQDWPRNFIDFQQSNSVRNIAWLRPGLYVPFWLRRVFEFHLMKWKYEPTEQEFFSARNFILRSGREPTYKEMNSFFSLKVLTDRIKKNGLTKKVTCPESLRHRGVRLWMRGYSQVQVAKKLSVHHSTVSLWVKKHRASQHVPDSDNIP